MSAAGVHVGVDFGAEDEPEDRHGLPGALATTTALAARPRGNNGHISGMTEASIRATITQLESLLPERSLTIQQLYDRYNQSLPAASWVASVKSTMKRFIARFGGMQISEFTPTHWGDYRDDPEIKGHYSVTTRNIHLRRAKAMFNWAVATGRIPFNPIARVKRETPKPKRETEVSHDDEAAVLERVDPLMRAYILAAIDGAMRRDEVRLLEWSNIDFVTGTVLLHAVRTKTKRHRIVRLTRRALEAIQDLPRWQDCPYVFANPDTHRPFHGTWLGRKWRKAADAAGLRPAPGDGSVRYHDLRGSCASRLSRLGAPVPAIQKILGHAAIATTMLYIRVNTKDVDDAYELLAKSPMVASPVIDLAPSPRVGAR